MSTEQEKTVICIPLHPGGGKFATDLELRFAIRSIEKHFKDPYRIVIVGPKMPAWLKGVERIPGKDLKHSVRLAADTFPEGFFWYYDDCCLLKDTTTEEMKLTPVNDVFGSPLSSWQRMLESIHRKLNKERVKPLDYSRPHGPYWFDKSMIDEAFDHLKEEMKGKYPFETWILSKRQWPGRRNISHKVGKTFTLPEKHHGFIQYSDGGNTDVLRSYLLMTFPKMSSYERHDIEDQNMPKKMGKLEVHTIRFGEADWMPIFTPTLDNYCERHSLPLRIWDNADRGYPNVKFCLIDMMKAFLEGESTHMMYIDADVFIHQKAPMIDTPDGFTIMSDFNHHRFTKGWAEWCAAKYGDSVKDNPRYCNAGVWICDRKSAEMILEEAKPPFIEMVMEQHQFNWWIHKAKRKGMKWNNLDPKWNRCYRDVLPSWFVHAWRGNKLAKLRKFFEKGHLPTKKEAPRFIVSAGPMRSDRNPAQIRTFSREVRIGTRPPQMVMFKTNGKRIA